jgi:hypothetical protein
MMKREDALPAIGQRNHEAQITISFGRLEFLAPPFVSRQKVEKLKKKD